MTNSHNCDDNAMCINTVGGFHCMCKMGYTGIGTEGNCTSKVSAVQNWSSVIHFTVTLAQLRRPGIGQNISCAVGDFANILSLLLTSERCSSLLVHTLNA